MKKIIYLLTLLVFIGCGNDVTLDSKIKLINKNCQSEMFLLSKSNPDLFNGYYSYELINGSTDLKKYNGKTYAELIPILVNLKLEEKKAKELEEEQKKKNKERAKKELPELKKKFNKNVDEFSNAVWYRHKTYGTYTPNRKTLVVRVNGDGYIYMTSNYHSSDWVFHTNVQVKVGEKTYKSVDIPTFKDNNRTDNSGGDIWEEVDYIDNGDNGIIKAIALNSDKKILVRFNGSKHYNEVLLSAKDKQAIKDCFELSQLIKASK